MNWYLNAFRNYAGFNGRARRKEFWMFALFHVIFSIAAMVLGSVLGLGNAIVGLYTLLSLLPGLAVAVRRLHDVDKSGLFILVGLIPVIGWGWLLSLLFTDTKPGTNQYGPNPKKSAVA